MATDTLEIFGTEYTGVTGIKATDDQSGTKVYIRPQGTKSISANGTGIDVTAYASVDVSVSSGVDLTTFTSSDGTTFTCNKTWAECFDIVDSGDMSALFTDGYGGQASLVASGYNGTNIYYTLYDINGKPLMDIVYHSNGTITTTTPSHTATVLTTKNITANGTYTASSDSADGYSSVTVNVSGGTSKNAQVVQSTTRTSASTLTAIGAELTVSKTGTYDIYYSCFRTNTSSSYTWATRLYINGTAYGTAENTTWTNNQQNTHLSNISLTDGDKLRVYGRNTRGTSYYICAPMLVIIEA